MYQNPISHVMRNRILWHMLTVGMHTKKVFFGLRDYTVINGQQKRVSRDDTVYQQTAKMMMIMSHNLIRDFSVGILP